MELSAASSGVAGISVDNILADVKPRGARDWQTQYENTRMAVAQLQMEKKGAQSQAQGRINAAPRPSPLSLVAGIGGSILGGYDTYSKLIKGAS